MINIVWVSVLKSLLDEYTAYCRWYLTFACCFCVFMLTHHLWIWWLFWLSGCGLIKQTICCYGDTLLGNWSLILLFRFSNLFKLTVNLKLIISLYYHLSNHKQLFASCLYDILSTANIVNSKYCQQQILWNIIVIFSIYSSYSV